MRAAIRITKLARRFWFEAFVLVALGVAIASAVIDQTHKDGPDGPLWFDVLAVIAIVTPLLAYRRFPLAALAAAAFAFAVTTFVDGRLIPDGFMLFLVAITMAALFGMRPRRVQAVAGWLLLNAVSALVSTNDPKGTLGSDTAWTGVIFTIAWIIGFALGNQVREVDQAHELAARAERAREEQAALAVAEERARIARELHDVVGHSVSVMTVQASAVRRLLEPDQVKENEALLVVEQTGREALSEMRRMVGVLRQTEEGATTPA